MRQLLYFGFFLLSLFLGLNTQVNAQEVPDWENPQVFERNQTSAHATLMPFANQKAALKNERKKSLYFLSLNGNWKFLWAKNLEEAPQNFYNDKYDKSKWDDIKVPSNWQMEGFGYPIFRNIGYNFKPDPPRVPKDFNPVGSYFRNFKIPANWDGKRIFLHFEGVQSASYVWVNGREIGYNQGGMEPAEYDITDYLKKGNNSIAVKVLRFCDGSYLEDQDTWRLSGIYRDVYLMATPQVHIQDFYVTTDLDKNYIDAEVNVELTLHNYNKKTASNHTVSIELYDKNESLVAGPVTKQLNDIEQDSNELLKTSFSVADPAKWSTEYPNLYTILFRQFDEKGKLTEILSSKIGFRKVEIKNQAIYINGVPIKFNGVNSHMLHHKTGHCIDRATLRKDLILMKRFNINCVRTSHYPPNVEYLEIADSIGMYVIDEVGNEAHWAEYLSNEPQWKNQYIDRMEKLVYRDRNHPSVVIWSAGNESGWGENICDLIEKGKKIDPSRPGWMYGGNFDTDPKTNPIKCEDIVGPRYLKPFIYENRFGKSDDKRPSFMDEYLAASGNSLGGLDEYWDLIYKYPRLTGGAIWDWISPGLTMPWRTTKDDSPNHIQSALINKAHLVPGKFGKAVYLSGHDDWVDIYRDPSLDVLEDSLSISFWIKPEKYNGNGYFVTKGNYEYGIIQSDKDSLEFYIQTYQKFSLKAKVPQDWENFWHHVMGTYDGNLLKLYINDKLAGTTYCNGTIKVGPYPVNIGRSAELWDIHTDKIGHATIDEVRIFNKTLTPSELNTETDQLKATSLLWLDFEEVEDGGLYYSLGMGGRPYGVVWPEREVQPELWQLKKSAQPLSIEEIDPEQGRFKFFNRFHFTNLAELDVSWELTANEKVIQKGKLELNIPALNSEIISIPYTKPDIAPDTYYQILIRINLAKANLWAEKGHEIAWEQFELPFFKKSELKNESASTIIVKDEKETIGIEGESFKYTINKSTGLFTSMIYMNKELLNRGPQFNVWRAPLSNESDYWSTFGTSIGQTQQGMGEQISNGWFSIGLNRLQHELEDFSVSESENGIVVTASMIAFSNNFTTSFAIIYSYTVHADGEIEINTKVEPEGYMTHWIPKVGLQMMLQPSLQNVTWFGRGPFETYPDRKTGAKIGKYSSTANQDYVPYIVPQDYGNKTDVRWLSISDSEGLGLKVRSNQLFNTSIQKYSTDNLTRALYTKQLKEADYITLNLDSRVSGLGGTASSVLNKYRVLPSGFDFTFFIKPYYEPVRD